MPGETAVETPQQPQSEVVEKKDIVEAEAKEAEASEKKDEEKKEKETADKAKAEKAKKVKPPPPPPVHKKDFEKDVVYVYQFNRSPTVPSVSPYCLKLETWLKLQQIKYEVGLSVHNKLEFNANTVSFLKCFYDRDPQTIIYRCSFGINYHVPVLSIAILCEITRIC